MTIRRRVEITVESKLLGLRRPPTGSPTAAVWCPHCSAPSLMLAPDEAAVLAGVSTRTIYR
ncbi:MAG: hypothetical protein HY011_01775 [Acidobacteria bacterium]|nr:hypothetical protein [Acidobacteriota bacterium]